MDLDKQRYDSGQCLPLTFLIELGVCSPPKQKPPRLSPAHGGFICWATSKSYNAKAARDETTKNHKVTLRLNPQQAGRAAGQHLQRNVYSELRKLRTVLSTQVNPNPNVIQHWLCASYLSFFFHLWVQRLCCCACFPPLFTLMVFQKKKLNWKTSFWDIGRVETRNTTSKTFPHLVFLCFMHNLSPCDTISAKGIVQYFPLWFVCGTFELNKRVRNNTCPDLSVTSSHIFNFQTNSYQISCHMWRQWCMSLYECVPRRNRGSSQEKGTSSSCRQTVGSCSEHTDKLCRLMAHQTVKRSSDNAGSTEKKRYTYQMPDVQTLVQICQQKHKKRSWHEEYYCCV